MSVVASNVTVESDFASLEVGSEMSVADLKAAIQSDTKIPPAAQRLIYNNRPITDDSRTLAQVGIVDGDMLALQVQDPEQGGGGSGGGGTASQSRGNGVSAQDAAVAQRQRMLPDPETLRLHMLGDQRVLEGVRRQNPQLADAANDPDRFRQILSEQQRAELDSEAAKEAKIAALNADPFNPDAQKEIEEIIRQNLVTENLHTAMEHTPEGESNDDFYFSLPSVIGLYCRNSNMY